MDGSLIPRYDSLLFVFHQESFNTNPFPRLDTAFSALSGCVRYKAFQLWSEHVGTFRKQPLLLNSPVSADECKIYLVQLGKNEEVFGVHSSSSAAIRIPIKEISSSQTYKQLRSNPESGLDPRIIMSPEYGGFNVPNGANWYLYTYDVLPEPSFMFTDLKQERGW